MFKISTECTYRQYEIYIKVFILIFFFNTYGGLFCLRISTDCLRIRIYFVFILIEGILRILSALTVSPIAEEGIGIFSISLDFIDWG